jgi:hypothetical protein
MIFLKSPIAIAFVSNMRLSSAPAVVLVVISLVECATHDSTTLPKDFLLSGLWKYAKSCSRGDSSLHVVPRKLQNASLPNVCVNDGSVNFAEAKNEWKRCSIWREK